MARYAIGGISSAAATSTLPAVTLYGGANAGGRVREIGLFNTTATAFYATVRKFSTAGTRGAGLDEYQLDSPVSASGTSNCTGADASTSTPPTLVVGTPRIAELGASIGSGVIWTFGGEGLVIPPGTANGIGILCPSGTGQIFTYYIEWDE
jgi:hypothetical protein